MQKTKKPDAEKIVARINTGIDFLNGPLTDFMALFDQKAVPKGASLPSSKVTNVNQKAHTSPGNGQYGFATRAESDTGMANRIWELVDINYINFVHTAINKLRDRADRGMWESGQVVHALLFVELVIAEHNAEIANAINETTKSVQSSPFKYVELIGTVAMLENDLRQTINEGLSGYLFEIGVYGADRERGGLSRREGASKKIIDLARTAT